MGKDLLKIAALGTAVALGAAGLSGCGLFSSESSLPHIVDKNSRLYLFDDIDGDGKEDLFVSEHNPRTGVKTYFYYASGREKGKVYFMQMDTRGNIINSKEFH